MFTDLLKYPLRKWHMQRELDPNHRDGTWDWVGNNIAFHCPSCGQLYIVSELVHRGERSCFRCGKSKGIVYGGRESGGTASIISSD
jgi:hypothetical protein